MVHFYKKKLLNKCNAYFYNSVYTKNNKRNSFLKMCVLLHDTNFNDRCVLENSNGILDHVPQAFVGRPVNIEIGDLIEQVTPSDVGQQPEVNQEKNKNKQKLETVAVFAFASRTNIVTPKLE